MISVARYVVIFTVAILCILLYPHLTPDKISTIIKENSVVAPLLFLAICMIRPVLFFLPSIGLTIVAGILFGALWGTVYVAIGGAISSLVGFYFARWLGRDTVKRLLAKNRLFKDIEKRTLAYGKNTVLYMRLFNLPWDMVSYWAGLSGVNFKEFYIASLIPLVPISFLYTYFGSKIFVPTSTGFIISLLIMFIMGSIPYFRSRWKRKTNG